MSNIDKHAVQAVADLKAGYTLGHADVAILNELARIALASLEVEPVAYMYKDNLHADDRFSLHTRFGNWSQEDINEYEITEIPLYTAPPAPVSVPDAIHSQGEKSASDDYYALGWNACRAAMLQGAEPVTTAYKLPFEQWLSQQTGTIDVECGCVMTEVFFHWLRVAYEAGNSPQCREISNSSTNNFRENAETSTKCWCRTCRPVTFADSHFVVCPECGNKRCPHANDHRHACTGSNEPGQEGSAYPAAPQQEVK
ncbi:hypothetical protein ABKV27_04985 [Enterobacter hormaechei]